MTLAEFQQDELVRSGRRAGAIAGVLVSVPAVYVIGWWALVVAAGVFVEAVVGGVWRGIRFSPDPPTEEQR